MIEYTLIRSRRKTASLHIKPEGVEVRVPLKYPRAKVDEFVMSKEEWINSKLNELQKRIEKKRTFALNYGDTIMYRGVAYSIVAKDVTQPEFEGRCFYLPPNLESDTIKAICVATYRHLARIHIIDRTAVYAELMGVTPAKVKINNAKTRWGSCSHKKNINFSWRLIMADDDVIDYVIVHELAHLLELNHSRMFWDIVENIMPNYRECNLRLNQLEKRLVQENWE
ncbi:MAG: M48 family metallopeptidase [Defluviitaleaceae bacterium]|nr:M48 family metallopeptidase [Defluviitaleaceae bacterium]